MSNQAESKNNTRGLNVTTKSIGIADTNVKSLAGFVLNQSDLSTAVTKTLISAGINSKAIRTVKVGCDQENKLRIIAELYKKSLNGSGNEEEDWTSFQSNDDDDNSVFSKEFFGTLRNKIYYKHLDYSTITRTVVSGKKKNKKREKLIQIEIDPEIFIAFAYNLNYTDAYYRISCSPIRFLNDKELNKKYDRNSDIAAYKRLKSEYLNDKLRMCTVIVTYSISDKKLLDMYNEIKGTTNSDDPNEDHNTEDYRKFCKIFHRNLTSGDFHPRQVSVFNGDDDDDK